MTMDYEITFRSGKVITLHNVVAVDYYNRQLFVSDGDTTYTFNIDEILHSERVGKK